MKITRMELFRVPPRWLFLRVETDEGLAGWGEPIVEGRAATVAAAVEELGEYLIGKDPRPIEDHFQVLYRGGFYRGGPVLTSALSGIEQALWDIKGQYHGVPVYELLGGPCREKVRVYAWIGGDRPQDVAAQARARVEAGYTALKMNATEEMHYLDSGDKVDAVVHRLAAVREAVGPGVDVAVDFHGRVHKAMARILARELEPFRPLFLEEPVLPEHAEALRDIRAASGVPIAAGERVYTRWGFKELLAQGLVDVIQPDVSHAGGIWECRKIAAMAEAYDVAVALHCPLGPIALAASLQVDGCTPNAFLQEQSLGLHYHQGRELTDYLRDPGVLAFEAGFVSLPRGPGLGIAVDEERVREAAREGHNWRNPVWRHADGTVAEW